MHILTARDHTFGARIVVQNVASPGILGMLNRDRVMEASKPDTGNDGGRQANRQPMSHIGTMEKEDFLVKASEDCLCQDSLIYVIDPN